MGCSTLGGGKFVQLAMLELSSATGWRVLPSVIIITVMKMHVLIILMYPYGSDWSIGCRIIIIAMFLLRVHAQN